MYPKTTVNTHSHRGPYNKTASSSNSSPDPIKDAYKLKSQIDAVEKSQQSFKTSEIIKIQSKLLTKAWKWISKYGIGSLNQYTKMKKQITNYDLLVNKIMSMQQIMESNFNALHRINKQHSSSLRHVETNMNKQFQYNLADKQHIISLLSTQQQQKKHKGITPNSSISNLRDDDLQEIQFPLTLSQIDTPPHTPRKKSSDQMVVQHKRLSPIIIRHSGGNPSYTEEGNPNVQAVESDCDGSSDTPSYKHDESSPVGSTSLIRLASEDSLVALNESSMMKLHWTDHEKPKFRKSNSVPSQPHHKRKGSVGYMDFKCTEQDNLIMDDIMENLTKLETISNDFNCFIEKDSDRYKQETQQMIQCKLKPLHEILEQRQMELFRDLKYLHKEKLIKLKSKQKAIRQHKNYLKMKLVECQRILQQYQTKWEAQFRVLQSQMADRNTHQASKHTNQQEQATKSDFSLRFKDKHTTKKITQMKSSLIRERTHQLTAIINEVRQQIGVQALEQDICNIKQMYLFSVDSTELHSLQTRLQRVGDIVDYATSHKNGHMASNNVLSPKSLNSSRHRTVKIDTTATNDADPKFSTNNLSKKFSSFVRMGSGRNLNSSQGAPGWNPSRATTSMCSVDSNMNLDHVNALDALSVSSADHEDDIHIRRPRSKKRSVGNVAVDRLQKRASVSVDPSAPTSSVLTITSDLP